MSDYHRIGSPAYSRSLYTEPLRLSGSVVEHCTVSFGLYPTEHVTVFFTLCEIIGILRYNRGLIHLCGSSVMAKYKTCHVHETLEYA